MIYRGKTKSGAWVNGFLVGYYKDVERTEIERHQIFEGIEGVSPIPVIPDTICEYVCKSKDGKDAFVGDIIQLWNYDKHILCLMLKTDMGYDIFPRYQEGSLWRLNIINGVGNFTVWGNKFDNPDTVEWLKKKDEWFRERTKDKWQKYGEQRECSRF